MPRFSSEDVRAILSLDHMWNTCHATGKTPDTVDADDLINHWLRHHTPMEVVRFQVEESLFGPDTYPLPPEPVNMCARCTD